jgi:hypothetical protein
MLELLNYLEKRFGGRAASAEYLGYSERQYYNIRRRLKSGEALSKRVEVSLLRKITHLLELTLKKKESQP